MLKIFRIALPLLLLARTAGAQSVLERTPNLDNGWTGNAHTAYFNFLHRFSHSAAPERQVSNSPTLLLAYAPFANTLLGVNYATRSDIAARFPNEWELFARRTLLPQLSLEAAYNNAARSVDGAIIAQHSLNRITLLATARAFSHAYDADSMRFAVAGGALVHLSRFIAIGGDVGSLIDRTASEKLAWSGALQLAIPSTPHSLSIQISNANTATLEGASRGEVGHRYGFEFTIPLHFSRFKSAATQTFPDGATRVVMKNIAFEPGHISIARGTTVAWRNEDQLAHTVTAVDHSWTSPLLPPGAVYTHTFDQPGRYEITCTPHPSMKLIVEVM